jgi:hypothetical protein
MQVLVWYVSIATISMSGMKQVFRKSKWIRLSLMLLAMILVRAVVIPTMARSILAHAVQTVSAIRAFSNNTSP